MAVEKLREPFQRCGLLKSGCEALARGRQEQIAASHEIDGVRKEKERLTVAKNLFKFLVQREYD